MESQGGEVTVNADDLAGAMQAAGETQVGVPGTGAGTGPVAASATMDPMTLLRENQCMACHQLAGEGGPIGPPLTGIGARLDGDAIRRGILDPNAEVAAGFEQFAGTMPTTYGQQFTAAQLEAIVQFLAAQR
ncbi:MAG TPA: c-type cytochrome, partial [Longimicrobiaceae bacterium]|nr:c-type cytochrome [Longimicrobiaceae bacterium]